MLGGEILSYVRDEVLDVAVKRRSFAEQSAAVGGVPLNGTELASLAALNAAAERIEGITRRLNATVTAGDVPLG